MLQKVFPVIPLTLVTGTHDRFDAAADVKVSDNFCTPRLARFNKILKHLIHDVLMKDTDISIEKKVLLQRFQFDTFLIRHVSDTEGREIRESRFRTYRSEF